MKDMQQLENVTVRKTRKRLTPKIETVCNISNTALKFKSFGKSRYISSSSKFQKEIIRTHKRKRKSLDIF